MTDELLAQRSPQFARGPSDALQCYSDIAETARRMKPYVGLSTKPEAGPFRSHVEYGDYIRELATLPVYFWSHETSRVVEQASRSYPLDGEMYLPRLLRALCVFQKPVLGAVIEGTPTMFSAVSWDAARMLQHSGAVILRVTGYHWAGSTAAPTWWGDVGAPDVPEPPMQDATYSDERATLLRWVLTASMFVEQEILSSSPEKVGKRVAARVAPHEPSCHVVALRRSTSQRAPTLQSRSVDWQFQWLVMGHWRRQFYPKAGRHVPIFIEPHWKGPADKPAKPVKPTVFAVTR